MPRVSLVVALVAGSISLSACQTPNPGAGLVPTRLPLLPANLAAACVPATTAAGQGARVAAIEASAAYRRCAIRHAGLVRFYGDLRARLK